MSAPELSSQLEAAQRFGWVGQGPIADHVAHSLAFGEAVGVLGTDIAVDLGSGGGLPGLVLAALGPPAHWHLVDAQLDRVEFLREAAEALALGDRVTVHHERVEDLGRGPLRGQVSLVTARSLGPPPLVAENAAPLLHVGGRLGVSEPPGVQDRWPAAALESLGLSPAERIKLGSATFVRMTCRSVCPDRYPRRIKPQRNAPLF